VIAFEPSPLFSKVLRKNVTLNGLRNIRIEQIALSDFSGSNPLYIRGGATSLDSSHYGLQYRKSDLVKVSRLDDFEDSLKNLDFIKIDVEGEENKVLRGARNIIDTFDPIIAIEVHNGREVSGDSCSCNTCLLVKSLGYRAEVTGEFSSVGQVHWVWGTPQEY
jgi:FkbM family methyltransferase